MLTPEAFTTYLDRLALPPATRTLLREIRQSGPVRRTEGRAHNVRGRYPSRKMGRTIQFESHKVELWAIYAMEHDPLILEYYDQPNRIKLEYRGPSGRKVPNWHPPDFLVLRQDSIAWEEWKPESELARLVVQNPGRYQQAPVGGYRCRPGEDYARALGLEYRVRSSAELPALYIQNLMFLEDYFVAPLPLPEEQVAPVIEAVREEPGLRLAALLSLASPQILYALIAAERLFCDWTLAPLGDHAAVRLYPEAAAVPPPRSSAQPVPAFLLNTALYWDGQAYLLVGQDNGQVLIQAEWGSPIALPLLLFQQLLRDGAIHVLTPADPQPTNPAVHARLAAASPSALAVAQQRVSAVQGYLHGVVGTYEHITPRTLRHWVAAFRAAEAAGGSGFIGLLPRTAQRGNRTPRADARTREAMDTVIREHYADPRRRHVSDLYRQYVSACTTAGLAPVSDRTFAVRVKQLATPEGETQRLGARVTHATASPYWSLEPSVPRHGDHPFAITHLDHTELDIELVSPMGQRLGRPWLSLLLDAWSRRILALYLTFDPPSYRAAMMTLRVCVRHHRRFPQSIVVDNGKDFESIYFDQLLARYGCVKRVRPPAAPRFGSVLERLFGTTTTSVLHQLRGNTQASKVPRGVTPATNPRTLAIWTLPALADLLNEWAYEVYDQTPHPALGVSPRETFTYGLAHSGERTGRVIAYDDTFIKATLPTTKKGTVSIQRGKGVRLFGHWYWNDVFAAPVLARQEVPIRYDPFDISEAWVYVEGQWVTCTSEFYAQLRGKTERELQLVTTELRQRTRQTPQTQAVTMARLITFWQQTETQEALLLQQLRDADNRTVRADLGVTPEHATPPAAPLATDAPAAAPIDWAAIPDYGKLR